MNEMQHGGSQGEEGSRQKKQNKTNKQKNQQRQNLRQVVVSGLTCKKLGSCYSILRRGKKVNKLKK